MGDREGKKKRWRGRNSELKKAASKTQSKRKKTENANRTKSRSLRKIA
jgi:hypothetical protein